MAIAQVAISAAQQAARYAPVVVDKASKLLAKATGGRVKSVADIPAYVGSNASRLSIAAGALNRAGVDANDIIPEDVVGMSPALQQIKARLTAEVVNLRNRYDQGADRTLSEGVEGDILRKKRVSTALRVFGSEESYFLCNPNGGIPREDFAWFRALFNRK